MDRERCASFQSFESFKVLVHGEANAKALGLDFSPLINGNVINDNHKLIAKQMLLHADRPLGISLQILSCNSSIQACIKSVGNHAKKSYLA